MIILVAFLLGGLVFESNLRIDTVRAYEVISGIITVDTRWTKENSPYNLTGNVAIDKGVTLTVEPGVIINLNGYYMRVNGTLTARGTSVDNVYLNGGDLEFTASSTEWNPQTGTGSIIENAIIKTVILATSGSSVLINNNTITTGIDISGSSIISKNTIAISASDPLSTSHAIGVSGTAQVLDNTISGGFEQATIYISGGSPSIQRNLISNNYGYGGTPGYGQSGIMITGDDGPIIKQNTIIRCANGIRISDNPNPTIVDNNIESVTSFNLYMGSRNVNIDVTNNWWGTTNTSEIDRKIWDFYDDFTLGKVNYVPFLTAANPEAMPDPDAPIPTPQPSPTPSSSPTPAKSGSDLVNTAVPIAVVVAVILVATVVFLHKRKARQPLKQT